MARRDVPPDRWITPLWLSHHYPEDYDRCLLLGHTHLCRRCTALYPLTLAVWIALVAAGAGIGPLTAWMLVVLPLPAIVELVLEQLKVLRYSATRQVGLTLVAAVGLGAGFTRYVHDVVDPLFWGVVVLYGGVGGAAILWRWRHPATTPGCGAPTGEPAGAGGLADDLPG